MTQENGYNIPGKPTTGRWHYDTTTTPSTQIPPAREQFSARAGQPTTEGPDWFEDQGHITNPQMQCGGMDAHRLAR